MQNDELHGLMPDHPFVRSMWRVQRFSWWILLVLLLAALIGVFGGEGWLNTTDVRSTGGVELRYNRFIHELDPNDLEVRIPLRFASNGQLQVAIDLDYLRHLEFQDINPEPEQAVSTGDRVIYTFQVDSRPAEDNSFYTILFGVTPTRIGVLSVSLSVIQGESELEPLHFWQIVYP
ncbi:MAG: hypothetical protein U0670_20135 [Anaerolineae bacterium]